MHRRVGVLLVAAVAVLAVVSLCGWRWVRGHCWGSDAICPGIQVDGRPLPPGASPEQFVAERARALSQITLEISVRDRADVRRTFSTKRLGVSMDEARTLAVIHGVGHTGSVADRMAAAEKARAGQIDVPLFVTVDPETAFSALDPLKEEVDELPVPAKFDIVRRSSIPEVPGRFVDLDGAIAQIREAVLRGADQVELVRSEIGPRVSSAFLADIDIHEQISRFQTGFSRGGEQANRARNIENAASKLDGAILLPHQVFSFNAVVGPRTLENGFSKGWEIFKGEMVEGVGGGTCQVASTLHATAFLAGLDVIERLPHSRPSAYITMGLDATVVYPIVDLKLRNPYDFPLVVHSYVEGNVVVFELHGKDRPAHVTFGRQVLATRAFTRKIEEKPGVPSNRIIRKQHGIRGYKIERTRTIALRDGSRRYESNVDIYPPTIEEYVVAPGTDVSAVAALLPALPEQPSDTSAGRPSWVPFSASTAESPPSSPSLEGAPAALGVAAACTTDCPPNTPKIIEAPGAHAPNAMQLKVPARILIAPAR